MINVKLLQLCTETLFDYAESMFTLCCAFAVHLAPFYEKISHYMDTFITGKPRSIHRHCVWHWRCPDSHPVQGNAAWWESCHLLKAAKLSSPRSHFLLYFGPLTSDFPPSLITSRAIEKAPCISMRLLILHSLSESLRVTVSAALSGLAGCDMQRLTRRHRNSSSCSPQNMLRKVIQNEAWQDVNALPWLADRKQHPSGQDLQTQVSKAKVCNTEWPDFRGWFPPALSSAMNLSDEVLF